MRIVFEYKGIEIIAQGGERELTLFVNRLVGNNLKKEAEKKPREQRKFRDKNCPVCKHDFTPRSAAQQRCDDCMKEGSKIPKGEKKSIKSPIQPPDRNCFGKQYEYGSAFCTGSCSVREKCRKAFEGGT